MNLEGNAGTETVIHICFDLDTSLSNGSEQTTSIPLADYLFGDQVFFTAPWRAPDAGTGTYYVYAWTDLNGNGSIDTSPNEELAILAPVFDLLLNYYIDFGAGEIMTYGDLLLPNYTCWDDFAPEIDLTIELAF